MQAKSSSNHPHVSVAESKDVNVFSSTLDEPVSPTLIFKTLKLLFPFGYKILVSLHNGQLVLNIGPVALQTVQFQPIISLLLQNDCFFSCHLLSGSVYQFLRLSSRHLQFLDICIKFDVECDINSETKRSCDDWVLAFDERLARNPRQLCQQFLENIYYPSRRWAECNDVTNFSKTWATG